MDHQIPLMVLVGIVLMGIGLGTQLVAGACRKPLELPVKSPVSNVG
jgi:uncharacterized membrane protein YczE